MSKITILTLTLLLAIPAFAQHRGGGFSGGSRGGGFSGGSRGGFSGGSVRSGSFGGGSVMRSGGSTYRGSTGVIRGGNAGVYRGGNYRGGYYRGGYYYPRYYSYYSPWYFGLGLGYYGYWGSPYYYGYPYSGYYSGSYYDPYYYDSGSAYYSTPSYNYPSSSQPVIINNQAPSPAAPAQNTGEYQPTIYSIAFLDHRIVQVVAYWVEDGTVHYVTRDHQKREVALSEIDRRFSEQINRDKGVEFRLPE